jgi:hypothetical protein
VAGLSVPSVLSAASFSEGVPPDPVPLLEVPPEVAASVMPTTTAATITAPPAAASQRCFRLRRASAALACAIFSRACCCLFLLPLDTAPFPWSGHRLVAGRRAAAITEPAISVIVHMVWDHGSPVTVRELFDELRHERPIAYATVMSTMDNLHRKGWLAREKDGKAYRYTATVLLSRLTGSGIKGPVPARAGRNRAAGRRPRR